jgi:hypothetical protein
VGSNLAEGDGFLREIKIRIKTSLGGKYSCRYHVVRFYGMKKIPAEHVRDTSSAN